VLIFMKPVATLYVLLVLGGGQLFGQKNGEGEAYRIVFYNLENYFDCFPDSLLSYNEFTAAGDYHWTMKKYEAKTRQLYKVFQNIAGWDGICLAGICEIENENVLKHLLYASPLKAKNYNYVHFDSPDKRGIDVALIYSSKFMPIHAQPFYLVEDSIKIRTRNILYVKGIIASDTVHIFVNHWTSRYRGVAESAPLRMMFSSLLKSKTDSILSGDPSASIIIMGDFNDQPSDRSLRNLCAGSRLHNLSSASRYDNSDGTVKFKEDWFTFDQMLVSEELMTDNGGLKIAKSGLKVFDADWLMEVDEKYLGKKPFRTNIGFSYHGGFSDHLPVYLDIIKTN